MLMVVLLTGCEAARQEPPNNVGGLRVGQVLGATDDVAFARAEVPRNFEFPMDHGPHPAYRSEWWYLTSVLRTANGSEIGVQYTLFRQALATQASGPSAWQQQQVYLAHVGVSDVTAGQHYSGVRLARAHPANAFVQAAPFLAQIEDWQLVQTHAEPWQLELQTADKDFRIDLTLEQTRPVRLQGDRGLSAKGPGQASYYYSIPRLKTVGEITVQGQVQHVSGWTWLDREWSTSVLGEHLQGWDWLALQLDDGRDLMAFRLRRKDGARDPFDHGLLVTSAGEQQHLAVGDFVMRPSRFWTDQRGAQWPVGWELLLHGTGERFQINAMLDDQLMDLGLVYWEGIVAVQSANTEGRGYLEMTGYRP